MAINNNNIKNDHNSKSNNMICDDDDHQQSGVDDNVVHHNDNDDGDDDYNGNVFHLISNTHRQQNVSFTQELIRYNISTVNDHKILENYHNEMIDLNCEILGTLKLMINMLEIPKKVLKINPNLSTPVFDSPQKSIGGNKRKYQQTPSSTNVRKIKEQKSSNRKRIKNLRTSTKMKKLVSSNNKENDQNIANTNQTILIEKKQQDEQTSLISKQCSIETTIKEEEDNTVKKNNSPIFKRTRAQVKREMEQQQQQQSKMSTTTNKTMTTNNNISTTKAKSKINSSISRKNAGNKDKDIVNNSISNNKQNKAKQNQQNISKLTTPTGKRTAKMTTTTNNNSNAKKQQQQQNDSINKQQKPVAAAALGTPSAKNINLRKAVGCGQCSYDILATPPVSKQRPEEIRVRSAQKLEKAAENRKMLLEQRQQQLRQRSMDSKNRLKANQQKQEQQLCNTNLTPSKQTGKKLGAFLLITGANNNSNIVGQCLTPIRKLNAKMITLNNNSSSAKKSTTKSSIPINNNNASLKKTIITNKEQTISKTKTIRQAIGQMKKLANNERNVERNPFVNDKTTNNNNNNNNNGMKNVTTTTVNISPIKSINNFNDDGSDDKFVDVTQIIINSTNNQSLIPIETQPSSSMMNYTEMMNKLPPPSSSTLNKTILKIIEQDKRMTPQKPTFMSTTMMMTNVTNNNNNNNQTHQYPMTPPPKLEESLISTYDISKYIDSEDEEEQEKIMEQRKDKRIPKWAAGRSLLIDLRQQYCQNGKQLDEQANRLYSYSLQENNNVQIDLDVIGLPVIPRYRNRTSSIIWTKPPISPIISNTNYNNSYANLMSEEEEY